MVPALSIVSSIIGFWAGGLIDTASGKLTNRKSSSVLPIRLLAALSFGAFTITCPLSAEWLLGIPFIAVLILVCICDVKSMTIPDKVTIPAIAGALAIRLCIHPFPVWDYLVAAILGSGIFFLIAWVSSFISDGDSIGGGDIKLLAFTGLALGINLSILTLFLLCLFSFLFSLGLLLSGRYKRNAIMPLAPFIATAAFISYLWGNHLETSFVSLLI